MEEILVLLDHNEIKFGNPNLFEEHKSFILLTFRLLPYNSLPYGDFGIKCSDFKFPSIISVEQKYLVK